jgi:hypothetical protein
VWPPTAHRLLRSEARDVLSHETQTIFFFFFLFSTPELCFLSFSRVAAVAHSATITNGRRVTRQPLLIVLLFHRACCLGPRPCVAEKSSGKHCRQLFRAVRPG